MAWSATDIPAQAGRRAVVTGANSGIGFQTALELARRGAHVVLAVRDEHRGAQALERLRRAAPGARAEVGRLDLADLSSVRGFAATVTGPLDVLVNNAGVMALPRRLSADGFELQLATNHLGPFALTGLLLDRLLASESPRVITVSSLAHRFGGIAFDDLQSERRYGRWSAYAQSKLANLLFALELRRRADEAGAALRSVAAHPGYAATNLQLVGPRMEQANLRERLAAAANRVLGQSDAEGALPTLFAATMDVPGGAYVGPGGPAELRGPPRFVGMSARATDAVVAARLWETSERLTGVSFPFPVVGSPGRG